MSEQLATKDAPSCPPAPETQRRPTRFPIPRGAVDTHAHVIGGPPDYPFIPGRAYTPPPATAESYIAMLDATGMTYGVLTQVSVHGTDNRLMVETLRAHPQRLRGIAVITPDCPERKRAALKDAGVVGIRANLFHNRDLNADTVERFGAICREMGWHLQFLITARQLVPLAARLAKLPVPFLIDHMGSLKTTQTLQDEGFRTLVSLVRDGGWVRLSGAYRNTAEGPPYRDTLPFAQALIEASPDRCVWGSDWPHVTNWGVMMQVADLLDALGDWAPDAALRDRILAGNPQQLFGFPKA